MNIKLLCRNIIYVPIVLVINCLILLIFAKLMECSILHVSAAPYLVLVSIIISLGLVIFLIRSKSNELKSALTPAIIYLIVLFLASAIKNGFAGNEHYYVKLILSVVCGVILGNFFGKYRYYRLRKSKKNRHFTTK